MHAKQKRCILQREKRERAREEREKRENGENGKKVSLSPFLCSAVPLGASVRRRERLREKGERVPLSHDRGQYL